MSVNKDYRSELDDWANMWAEMEKANMHPPMEKPQPSPFAQEILGTKAQDMYYDYLDSEELFQEDTSKKTRKSPNPVYPDSVGPDSEGPKSVWVNEDLLKEVESLKNRLFKLENVMARMGQSKRPDVKKVHNAIEKTVYSEINNLKKRIDRVSSQLGIQDEPSPWQIKRD